MIYITADRILQKLLCRILRLTMVHLFVNSRDMNHYCYNWIEDWCQENGWTDLFVQEKREYWAFPPNAVMPLPIPNQALRLIKAKQGFSPDEKRWCWTAIAATVMAACSSLLLQSPMPLVAAFAFCAMIVAQLEVE